MAERQLAEANLYKTVYFDFRVIKVIAKLVGHIAKAGVNFQKKIVHLAMKTMLTPTLEPGRLKGNVLLPKLLPSSASSSMAI